ncbi:MFS transporter [Microbacterium sp. B2969]|uniref:MFS transporter n=1 Tax=Microbacterium alkaliflavum TaxID=3248839 RepID=A0ABW7QE89_9MICO
MGVFAAGSTAIPLFTTYRTVDGLTDADFSVVTVAYFLCAVLSLLVLGRLSDHLGRRPVSIAALLLAAAGTLTLTTVHGLWPLLIGRMLQGIAAGLAASAIAAYAVDTAPRNPKWLVATVTSMAPSFGLSIGVFGSAILVEFAPAPRVLVFVIVAGLLLVCAGGIAAHPETVRRNPGARRSMVPRLTLPASVRPFMPVAAAIFISTWAFGGYVTAFAPSVASGYLHSTSPVIAAAVFASYQAPGVLGGPLSGKLRPATAQRLAMGLVVIAAAGFIASLLAGSAVLFIAAGILGGIGMGMGMSSSMRILLPLATPAQRAGLLAVIYAMSYLGAAIPSLIAGQLTRTLTLLDITVGYAALAAVAGVIVLIGARNPAARASHPTAADASATEDVHG